MHGNSKQNLYIDHVSRKVSMAIGVSYSLKNMFPSSTLLTLYNKLALMSTIVYGYGVPVIF